MSTRTLAPLGELDWDAGMRWWQSGLVPVGLFDDAPMIFCLRADLDQQGRWPADVGAAIAKFLALRPANRAAMRDRIFAHYERVAARDPQAPRLKRERIWDHFEPGGEIAVTRHAESVFVLLECSCDWDPEHGLQLVFLDGELTRASVYDEQLTDPPIVAAGAVKKKPPAAAKKKPPAAAKKKTAKR